MLELGQFIKEKRETSGLSLKALGDIAGISDSEIHKIENGTRKNPSWENLCKIATALGSHPFEILHYAGYITDDELKPYISPIQGLDDLNSRELEYVKLFINFIKTQRQSADTD